MPSWIQSRLPGLESSPGNSPFTIWQQQRAKETENYFFLTHAVGNPNTDPNPNPSNLNSVGAMNLSLGEMVISARVVKAQMMGLP